MSRLDNITVATSRGIVELPWASREALLDEIRHLEIAESIVTAFDEVGASSPVQLTRAEAANLFGLLNFWCIQTRLSELPEGIWDLRNALAEDV